MGEQSTRDKDSRTTSVEDAHGEDSAGQASSEHDPSPEEDLVCAVCGHPIGQDDLVCPNCGVSLAAG